MIMKKEIDSQQQERLEKYILGYTDPERVEGPPQKQEADPGGSGAGDPGADPIL